MCRSDGLDEHGDPRRFRPAVLAVLQVDVVDDLREGLQRGIRRRGYDPVRAPEVYRFYLCVRYGRQLATQLPTPQMSIDQHAKNVRLKAFVDGVTAAASGAIAGAAFVLGKRAIIDVPTALIAVLALVAMTYVKKAPEPLIIIAAGGVGLVLTAT